MKPFFAPLIALYSLLNFSPMAEARESDKDRLISSCVELVIVYKNRSEKRLQAALTTSLSEALMAGYCRGVLEEHANHTRGCSSSDWLNMAKFIAGQDLFRENYRSSRDLLGNACNG